MLTRTQALEGGANVTCISKVSKSYFTYRSIHPVNHFWAATLQHNTSLQSLQSKPSVKTCD